MIRGRGKDIIKEIGEEAFMPFAVGGGINHIDHVKQLISAGTEKVIINTAAIENPSFIEEIAELYGRQSIIASIDVKKKNDNYKIYTHSGKKQHNLDLIETIHKIETAGAGEILINSIDQDGMMNGYDVEIANEVADGANSVIREQVTNGIATRMAILSNIEKNAD